MNLDAAHELVEGWLRTTGGKFDKRRGVWLFSCPHPAHADRNPSAEYDPNKKVWICRSCGRKGGVVARGTGGTDGLLDLVKGFTPLRSPFPEVEKELDESRQRQAALIDQWWHEHHVQRALVEQPDALRFLEAEGITAEIAARFNLGYSMWRWKEDDAGPWEEWPSVAIPWMREGAVKGVQLRLIGQDPPGGRYRVKKGSSFGLFNGDHAATGGDRLVVVEGAKKAMVLCAHGIEAVAIFNSGAWKAQWGAWVGERWKKVVFALDPDAIGKAVEAARSCAVGRVAVLPQKPDDIILASSANTLNAFLNGAIKV